MILILVEKNDKSAYRVKEWIDHFQKKSLIIEDDEEIKIKEIGINQEHSYFIIEYQHEEIHSDSITSVWIRRGFFKDGINSRDFTKEFVKILDSNSLSLIHEFLNQEIHIVHFYLYYVLKKKRTLGRIAYPPLNKLIVLEEAVIVGLSIPKTKIVTNKKDLLNFYLENNNKIITKPISDCIQFTAKNKLYSFYTNRIIKSEIALMNNDFLYSLVQNQIDKKFELRIFFFKKKYYSMAVFSQLDKNAKIDSRKFDNFSSTPSIPFNLPDKIQNKLIKLTSNLKIDTGSIDMVVNKHGDYIFLEINPDGMFDMVSVLCNYKIEQDIAKYLIGSSSEQLLDCYKKISERQLNQ